MYVEAAKRFISLTSRLTTERWGCQFVHKLMVATHKQWLFRNSYVHCTKLDGLTVQQHEDIFACVKEPLLIDPADLLPCHQHLLEGDFTDLGEGATVNRQCWVASMDASVSFSSYVCTGLPTVGDPTIPPGFFSTEGSSDDEEKSMVMS